MSERTLEGGQEAGGGCLLAAEGLRAHDVVERLAFQGEGDVHYGGRVTDVVRVREDFATFEQQRVDFVTEAIVEEGIAGRAKRDFRPAIIKPMVKLVDLFKHDDLLLRQRARLWGFF